MDRPVKLDQNKCGPTTHKNSNSKSYDDYFRRVYWNQVGEEANPEVHALVASDT